MSKMRFLRSLFLVFAFGYSLGGGLAAQGLRIRGIVELEAGAAFTGYNDLRIPADTGSDISLKSDIPSDPALALRTRLGLFLGERHRLYFLAAPLSARGSAVLSEDLDYQGTIFTIGTSVESLYRFDSYRLSYRYAFRPRGPFEFAAGAGLKLRSADIAIMSSGAYEHREDLGFVPLLSFLARWEITPAFGILLDAEGLVSPFGRAEDALLALEYRPSENLALRLGYRILEGGSDGGGGVYTFALFHYAVVGIAVSF